MSDQLLTEIAAEREPGTFVENLADTSDGGWLVTIPSHHRIDRVDREGHTAVFVELDRPPTGIVADATGVDPATGEPAAWLRHPLLLAPAARGFMPGANGAAVHGKSVYIFNTTWAMLRRCSTAGRSVAVVAENLTVDDFVVHPDGRIFLATHHGNSVLQLDADGRRRAEFAGPTQGLMGSTAVALDPGDPDVLYVTTTGGMRGLHDRNARPARLVRLRFTSGGAT